MTVKAFLLTPFILVAGLTWGLGFYVWRRSVPGIKAFGLMMVTLGAWSFFYFFELLSNDLSTAIFWINLEYIAVFSVPLLWSAFVIAYTGRDRWLTRLNILLFSLFPAAGLILTWTDNIHHLVRQNITATFLDTLYIIDYSFGPVYWLLIAYSYLLLIFSMLLLIPEIFHQKHIFRAQRVILLLVLFIPWMADIITEFKIGPDLPIDLTVFGFALMALALTFGLLRYQMLNPIPIARHRLMEFTNEAVIVVDNSKLVVDINHGAERLLNKTAKDILGKPLRECLIELTASNLKMIETSSEVDSHTEITLKEDEDGRSYDVFITPLIDNKNNLLGRLIVFRDVTTHLNNQVVLQQSNYELEGRVNLRTAELRASEERYALAARGTNDGIWDWDILNDRVHYSPRWKAMFGFEEDELGMSIDEWFLRVHPDDIQRVRAELAAHLHNETEDFSSEHRLMHKNDDYGWVLVRGVAIRDKDNIPERIAGSFSDITARKRIEEQLIHDALHDSLTGLPNRALLNDRLGRACQRSHRSQDYRFALLYIDLDNFKVINDSLGHKYGDKVLIECSNRILNCLRNIDTVARIGGDEFVILIEEMDDYQNSRIAAERIQNAISLPMYLDGNIVYISASIGIRISHIIGESAEDFLRDADIAMYHAKGSGKSCFKEFDISMRDQAMERVQLENELRAALSHHEETQQLFVYYQPIISLEDGIISGFEALTRWRHPLRGFIPPKKFIPVAEESGLICDLGGWVMSEACRQIQAWNCKYQNDPPRSVSVNLSARQFARENLINDITQILQETGLSPQYLKLEITESVLVDEPEIVGRTLEQLRRLGVHLQIDDFGTGYSSLSYLHRLPVDAIKIDQSFVNKLMNPEEGASITEIVRTIISLAWELGITIIAEGVERQEQYTWLRDNECNYAQGYLISEPLDPSAVEVFLENQVEKVSTY